MDVKNVMCVGMQTGLNWLITCSSDGTC